MLVLLLLRGCLGAISMLLLLLMLQHFSLLILPAPLLSRFWFRLLMVTPCHHGGDGAIHSYTGTLKVTGPRLLGHFLLKGSGVQGGSTGLSFRFVLIVQDFSYLVFDIV